MKQMGRVEPSNQLRPVVYLTNNGLGEPHVASQVLPYLERLDGRRVFLVTCEKKGADPIAREEARRRLDNIGAQWSPIAFRGPPAGALHNVLILARAARDLRRNFGPVIVHARSYVAAAAAHRACRNGEPWIFDMRGFYLEERIEAGLLRRGGLSHRLLRRAERRLLGEATAVVTLTQTAADSLRSGMFGVVPRDIRVIPCAIDTEVFTQGVPGGTTRGHAMGRVLQYAGTLGGGYLDECMGKFAAAVHKAGGWRVAVASRQDAGRLAAAAVDAGMPRDQLEVTSLRPTEVPAFLARGTATMLFVPTSLARSAMSPIKVGESLASGLPVAISAGCGDSSDWIAKDRVGVVVDPMDDADLTRKAWELVRLCDEPGIADRCRTTARTRLGIDAAAATYRRLYADLEVPR